MAFSTCWKCGSQFWMPDDLEAAARRDSAIAVYCAHGHRGYFSDKPTEADNLRLERDRLKQALAQRDDEIARQRENRRAVERQLSAQRGVVTRIKNRVGHGVCPCCNRYIKQLGAHMKTKHPDFIEREPSLKVVA